MQAALVAVVLVLAFPGAADAQSFSVPAHLRNTGFAAAPDDPAGPALAGDRVLWWENRTGTAVLVSARAGEAPRDLLALRAVPARGIRFTRESLAANQSVAIVRRVTTACRGSGGYCDGPARVVADERLKVDLATGAATPFDLCLGAPACRRCPAWGGRTDFDLIGSVFAATDGCGGGVLDLADGATRRFDGPVVSAAGRYTVIGTGEADDRRFELIDWRTGARLHRLTDLLGIPRYRLVSVADDGTVAWASIDAEVWRPGAKDPTGVPFPAVPGGSILDQVRLAAGRLAVRRVTRGSLEEVGTFQITRPDGSQRREIDGQRVGGGWAFDGLRLAWATQPCAQFTIQVWDLAAAPPAKAPERCARPVIDTRPIHLTDTRALPVTLTCPPAPAQGCAGLLGADLRSGRRVVPTYLQIYRLPAGSTRTVRLAVIKRRRLRGLQRLRAKIEFEAFGGGGSTAARVTVTRR